MNNVFLSHGILTLHLLNELWNLFRHNYLFYFMLLYEFKEKKRCFRIKNTVYVKEAILIRLFNLDFFQGRQHPLGKFWWWYIFNLKWRCQRKVSSQKPEPNVFSQMALP